MSARVGLRPEWEVAKEASQVLSSVRRLVDCVRVVVVVVGKGSNILNGGRVFDGAMVNYHLRVDLSETRRYACGLCPRACRHLPSFEKNHFHNVIRFSNAGILSRKNHIRQDPCITICTVLRSIDIT